ncbi:MAG TPA: ABC transporter substrate-binding protein [Candidatus Dormibacteraeota bacterium]|nr:ABC transporter substrate-binding protein [Candidatus Dormibacteraeota bacterium]
MMGGNALRIRGMAIVCVAGLLAACGSSTSSDNGTNTASAPGITATTITIGSTQPLTGRAAPGYSEISAASSAYFQVLNAHGGIFGRTITYTYYDDGYNPTNTASLTRKLILEDKVFALFSALGTPTHQAVVDYINTQKVPDLFVSSGCNCWNDVANHPYTFGWQPDYTIEGKILGQYIQQSLGGKKVGYFFQNDEFGLDGVKGLDAQLGASSVPDANRQYYVPTNTNVKPQIAALQASGAQVVVSFSIPAFTALAMLAAAGAGYHPIWVVSNVGSDITTLTGLLKSFSKGAAGGQLLAGMVTDTYLPLPGDSSNPWISLFKKIHDDHIASLPWDGNVLYGMAQAYTLAQALKAAGRNPTRASLVKSLETNQLSGGPGLAPLGFSSTNHLGFLGVQLVTIAADGTETTTGPVNTSSDSGPISPYSGSASRPPANGIP